MLESFVSTELSLSSSRGQGTGSGSLSPLYRGVPPETETWAEMRGLWRPGGSLRTVVLLDEKGRGLRCQNKESFLATGPAASELKRLHQHFPYLRGPEWGHQSHHESAITHQCLRAQKGERSCPRLHSTEPPPPLIHGMPNLWPCHFPQEAFPDSSSGWVRVLPAFPKPLRHSITRLVTVSCNCLCPPGPTD